MPSSPRRPASCVVGVAVAALSALTLAACAAPPPSPPSVTGASSASPTATPAYAGPLGQTLQRIAASTTVPGAVVLVRSGRYGDATYALGTRTAGGSEPVTPRDHVRIGSVTKSMTATVVLQLVQEGRIALEDPVSRYVPGVPAGDQVTLAELLDMRSGLFSYTEDPRWLQETAVDPRRRWTPQELLDLGRAHPSYFAPGASYHYTNTAYVLLGMIMEQVTGQTVSRLFAQRLFTPLGMRDTVLPGPGDTTVAAPAAHGYEYATFESALTPEQQAQATAGTLRPTDVTDLDPSWAWTAGGVVSTPEDTLTWVRALVDGTLLSPALQAQRLASVRGLGPDFPQAVGYAYGYGLEGRGSYLGHAGAITGYNTAMMRDPATDTSIVAVATLTLSPDGRPVAAAMADAVRSALGGGSPSPSPSGT